MALDIEQTYARYGPMVLRRCRRLLADENDAVDAMHDVFVELLRRRERLDDGALSSLLYRTATNVCLNRIRTRRRRPEDPYGDLLHRIAHAHDPRDRILSRLRLGSLFAQEQPSTQTLAVLHLADGMTLEQVAGVVGLSVSGVRKRLRTLRRHLVEIEEVGDEP